MIPILSGNVASATAGGYEVANSCRFDGGSSYLTSGSFGTATSATTWTFSLWIKRSEISSVNYICGSYDGSRTNSLDLVYDAADTLSFYHGSNDGNGKLVKPARLFRDPAAWTHVVWSVDTTQGTAANRVKVYFNGTEDAKATATYPDEDAEALLFADTNNKIGSQWNATSGTIFDGYMAEVVFIDGQALTPSSFGEFDEDSPTIWKPIDVSGLTFGDNGFYLDFEDSSALGNDVSGNNNDFTTSGLAATDQATDTPTNNFCTLNPLASGVAIGGSAGTFTEGNTRFAAASAAWCSSKSTFSVSNGKWYYEAKKNSDSAGDTVGAGYTGVGYAELQSDLPATNPTNGSGVYSSILFLGDNGWTTNFADGTQWGTPQAVDDGDIIGIALNLDDDEYTFYVNGSSVNNGSLGAGYDGNGLTPCIIDYQHARNFYLNFGNPSYANSSDAADANGYGAFEYAPPSGFYALCTKNLAEYG